MTVRPVHSALDDLPSGLPALARGVCASAAAAAVGFDWRRPEDVLPKLDEEAVELRQAMASGDRQAIEGELGDALFTLVNLARKLAIDPEAALAGTVARFERRFRQLEAVARAEGLELRALDDDELERRWQQAKADLAADRGQPSRAESSDSAAE